VVLAEVVQKRAVHDNQGHRSLDSISIMCSLASGSRASTPSPSRRTFAAGSLSCHSTCGALDADVGASASSSFGAAASDASTGQE